MDFSKGKQLLDLTRQWHFLKQFSKIIYTYIHAYIYFYNVLI